MRIIRAILNENINNGNLVFFEFKINSETDNLWLPSLEELGNIIHSIYRAEDLKYKPKKGRGGEFSLDYLCERARGASHEELKDKYHFKK
jgi:hypothetical protein